ncbi:MAG: hypothetical protein N2259_02180 [Patescibacteria group bacterium]|nr:hypothetical protein [Patescibacteria group bacterium]
MAGTSRKRKTEGEMKKIILTGGRENLKWECDVIFHIPTGKFFVYDEEVHKILGGRMYYRSRSGLHYAGWIPSRPEIVLFGWYHRFGQKGKLVHVSKEGKKIQGFFPMDWDYDHQPIILTDGSLVAYMSHQADEIMDVLLAWDKIKEKSREVKQIHFDEWGTERESIFYLYNPNRYRPGISGFRFTSDIESINISFERKTLLATKANLKEVDGVFLHLNAAGFFDRKWEQDPRTVRGELIEGWYGEGEGLFWRRTGIKIEAFIESRRRDVNGGKYVHPRLSEYVDYEENFPLIEWFSKPIEEWKKYFKSKIIRKAALDLSYYIQEDVLRELMKNNPDVTVSVEDSVAAGNCRVASEEFIKKYKLPLDSSKGCITIKKILEHAQLEEMLTNAAFRKVISMKLMTTSTSTE